MSNMKHVAGVLLAGILAFGGVFAASAISAPLLHGIPAGSSSGRNEPTDEVAMIDRPDAFTLVGTWTNRGDEITTVEFTPDGNWRGTVGCSEFTGTWMLGVRNVPVLEDNSTEPKPPVLLSGPANLVIGPEADGTVNVCEGGPAKFVLSYDTEYLFHAGADGTFTVEGTEAAPAEPLVFVSR